MSIDLNWNRWIFASLSVHFDAIARANSPPVMIYTDGADRNTDDLLEYLEFRMNGPTMVELSKDWWRVEVEVNIFCAAKRQKTNFHRIHALTGLAVSAFTNSIPVLKLGTGAEDDQSSLTCMVLTSRRGQDIVINQFGQVNTDLLEMQATVDGCYEGYIDGSL